MKCGLFLNVVVTQGSAIFQLLTGEDQPLLVWGNSFFVLDFCFHVFNGVAWLDFQGDCLASQGLDEDLHSTTKAKDQVKGGLFLNVVVAQGSAIFQLFASENKTLLVGRDAFFVLDFCLHVFDSVAWLDFQGNCLTSKSLHKDLHSEFYGSEFVSEDISL